MSSASGSPIVQQAGANMVGNQGVGSTGGGPLTPTATSSSSGTATGTGTTSTKMQSLTQIYQTITSMYQMSNSGKLTQSQTEQFRTLINGHYRGFLHQAWLLGRPNPFAHMPDALNPSVLAAGFNALTTPEEWREKTTRADAEIRSHGPPPPQAVPAPEAARRPSAPIITGNTDAQNSTAQPSPTTVNQNSNSGQAESSTSAPAPASTQSQTVPKGMLSYAQMATLKNMGHAELQKLFVDKPAVKAAFYRTLNWMKQRQQGTTDATQGTSSPAPLAAAATVATSAQSTTAGADSTDNGSSMAPAPAPGPNADTSGTLPDVSKFNLSQPPALRGKRARGGKANVGSRPGQGDAETDVGDDGSPEQSAPVSEPSHTVSPSPQPAGTGNTSDEIEIIENKPNVAPTATVPPPVANPTAGPSTAPARPLTNTAPQNGPLAGTYQRSFPPALPRPPTIQAPLEPERRRRKRKIAELVQDLAPGVDLEVGVSDVLSDMVDQFLQDALAGGSKLANHRQAGKLETRDMALYLDLAWDMHVPGYDGVLVKKQRTPNPDARKLKGVVPLRGGRRGGGVGGTAAGSAGEGGGTATEASKGD